MTKKKFEFPMYSDYCVVDTETTGLSPREPYNDKIIQIGVVKVRNNEIVDEFETLINPLRPIPWRASNINHITDKMVKDAPLIEEMEDKFFEFIGEDVLIGHNISFDLKFLNNELSREIKNESFDTRFLARKVLNPVGGYSLANLAKEYYLTENLHRAVADCITTKELYELIKAEY